MIGPGHGSKSQVQITDSREKNDECVASKKQNGPNGMDRNCRAADGGRLQEFPGAGKQPAAEHGKPVGILHVHDLLRAGVA